SASQKYLNRIWVRDREHDGAKMTGDSYRIPAYPVAPGTEVPQEDMVVLTEMPVKSIITFPETGAEVKAGEEVEVRGHAWRGRPARMASASARCGRPRTRAAMPTTSSTASRWSRSSEG